MSLRYIIDVSRLNFLGRLPMKPWARTILPGAFIVLAVFLAYLPALHGAFVWDDDSWTTNLSTLFQNTSGLYSIWFQPTALQQYYPLTGTTFWLDYQFLGVLDTALPRGERPAARPGRAVVLAVVAPAPIARRLAGGGHLRPASGHGRIRRLDHRTQECALPGPLSRSAAGLPALCTRGGKWPGAGDRSEESHSCSDSSRDTRHPSLFYGLAFILFLGALLAKTTTFSLPAVILLLGWWQRGHIRWRADVLPTLPFFALSICLCAVTAWLEKNHVGAQGPDFALTFPQRCLIAGHAFWFYLGNLFWPANLCFVYPRWQPDPGCGGNGCIRSTAVGTLFTLWLARRRIGRGPAAALFFFVGTLFPVLGFMNAYGMRYSFVWDHWVYLSASGSLRWRRRW